MAPAGVPAVPGLARVVFPGTLSTTDCPTDCPPAGPDCTDLCNPPPLPPPPPRIPWRLRWDPCQTPPSYWVGVEYLNWHVANSPQPNNLGDGSRAQTLAELVANPVGLTGLGDRGFRFGVASGLRVSGGHWFGPYNRLGVEANGFMLEKRVDGTTLSSDAAGTPAIIRPFTNASTGLPDFSVVSLPNTASGRLTVQSDTRVWGTEANFLIRMVVEPDWYVTPLVGIRYLDLNENLDIYQDTTLLGRGASGFAGRQIGAPNGVSVADGYETQSRFLGGQFGARFGTRVNRLDAGAYLKVGLGWTHHTAAANGSTTLVGPGGGAVVPGGLLVVPTNSYRTTADDMGVVPEFGLQLGYDIAPAFRLTFGYSALYWSRVVRPGDQVQTVVNPSQVPSSLQFGRGGPLTQPPPLTRDGLWINGVQFGAVVRF